MPNKRKRSITRHKKRSYKKRRYNRNRFTTKPYKRPDSIITIPGKHVLPVELKTQFRFTFRAAFAYTGSTTTSAYANLKANSLTDPMGTSGTAQPPMFDQLMVYYRKYTVIGCQIKCTISARENNPATMFYIVPVSDATATYSMDTAINMPGAKKILITDDNSSGSTTIVNYRRTDTQLGKVIGDDTIQGTATTDPTSLWYWHISFVPMQINYGVDFTSDLVIEYCMYCILSDPQLVGNS